MNRGNRRALIFEDDRDRKRFVSLLIQFLRSFEVELLVGCLMGNHFHLIVTTPLGNLSWFMQQLEGQFATYSNWRHQRVGHLFQGRFRGVLIESDLHLLIAACYVFVNPVVAGLCDRPEQWKWSTYSSTAGITSAPEYLSLNWVSELFQSASLEACQRLFRKLMDQAHPVQSYLAQADWLAPCEPMTRRLAILCRRSSSSRRPATRISRAVSPESARTISECHHQGRTRRLHSRRARHPWILVLRNCATRLSSSEHGRQNRDFDSPPTARRQVNAGQTRRSDDPEDVGFADSRRL